MQQVVGSDDRKDCCCRRITTMRRTAAVNYSRVRALPPGSASRRRSWSVRVGLRTLLGVGRCPIASYVWLGDALWRHGKNLVVTVMVALRITSNIPTAGMPRHAKHVPPKVPIPVGSGPPSNTWFLELHESKHQVEISIGWTVLQDSSDKQTHTDRPRYSVCSNKPHLTDAAVQPNNSNLLILSPTKVVTLDMLTKVESTDKLSLEVAPTPLSLFAVSNLSLLFSRSCRSQPTSVLFCSGLMTQCNVIKGTSKQSKRHFFHATIPKSVRLAVVT